MEKLDRLGWTAGISFEAYGRTFGIRSTDPSILDEVRPLLPYGSREVADADVDILYSLIVPPPTSRPGLKRYYVLYNSSALVGKSFRRDLILSEFDMSVTAWVAEYSRTDIFLHAGVVEWQGRAIVIPGRSRSGKSTLVSELVKAGARYYSDEYAPLTSAGRVRPYLKPISIRDDPMEKPTLHAPESLGTTGSRPVPVGCVLLTEYREGAVWHPRRLSAGEAMFAVLNDTIAIRQRPRAAMSRLRKALDGSVILKGARGEASQLARRILASPPWEK